MENQYKEEFRAIFQEHVVRRGGDQLLEWLENTDFFTAPASTSSTALVNMAWSCTA